jgi:hypothetical protein
MKIKKLDLQIVDLYLIFFQYFSISVYIFLAMQKNALTTHLLGMTLKVCSSLLFATSTVAPNSIFTVLAKAFFSA